MPPDKMNASVPDRGLRDATATPADAPRAAPLDERPPPPAIGIAFPNRIPPETGIGTP